jgi:hypothetical protein
MDRPFQPGMLVARRFLAEDDIRLVKLIVSVTNHGKRAGYTVAQTMTLGSPKGPTYDWLFEDSWEEV